MVEPPRVAVPDVDARATTGVTTSTPDAAPVVRSGVDVVSIDRVRALLDEFGDSVRERVFTPAERAYCEHRGTPAESYAARWAAKEAFAKCLDDDVAVPPFAAVAVARSRESPTPELDLAPRAAAALECTLRAAGVDPEQAATTVSLSHDRDADSAVAQVVVVGLPAPDEAVDQTATADRAERGQAGARPPRRGP